MMPDETIAAAAQATSEPVIVAIGASAGGVQALQTFFDALPEKTGAAYVVVVHLDPERRSELPSILATRTRMPVVQVAQQESLRADHVFVIPPDRQLQVVDHAISAVAFDEPRGHRSPIDLFFRSMADRLGDGFAIVLSGAGSDGTIGVRAAKEAGGIVLVQDPIEAEFGSMPRSAIATGAVDFVLPVRDLAARLVDLIRLKRSGTMTKVVTVDDEALRRIMVHLRTRTGHDFSKYKRSTVLRRIARRMQVTQSDTLDTYYEVLREKSEEARSLLSDMLISVTTFFRDREYFEALSQRVLPRIFETKASEETLRVWVCGCATGEEAYSVAMLLLEKAARHEPRPAIQIFGTDLDARALAVAREGRYPASIETDVSEDRLRRFFVHEGDAYRVRQELRDVVLFAAHDLLKDPPFSHVALITCRNVLIYLDRELQEQLCGTFHYALDAGGFLMLGSSESCDQPAGLFRSVDRAARLYQSTAAPGDKPRLLPGFLGPVRLREPALAVARAHSPASLLSEASKHREALERVAPPSVLVDATHRVLHMSNSAGRYLWPAGGPLSGDVVDLVRPELRFELRSALNRLFEQQQASLSLPIPVRFNGAPHRIYISVKPFGEDEAGKPASAVVMFIEGEAVDEKLAAADERANSDLVRRLSEELELAQSRLQTVREESDATTEELRAANEELQSINEEYRSTSEELETSKEELQSINEELQTVNTELKLKLEAISRAHSDLQNLMAATDIGTLFLDSSLRIKRFTERVTELFSLTPADESRPITDFSHQLDYDNLIKDVRAVLAELIPIRREIRGLNDRWYDVRIRPYRTVEDRIDGVVITFVDVTESQQVEAALRESERQLRQTKRLIDLSRDPIFIWDFDDGIVEWNRGCEELYGFTRREALGKHKDRLLDTEVLGSSFAALKAELLDTGHWRGEIRHRAKDGRTLTVESQIDLESVDGRRLVLESTRDITEQKKLLERQRLLLSELTHRVKNSLAVVQSLAHQTLRTNPTPDEFMTRFGGRLSAMANAHGLLVQSNWEGADLAALARIQLAGYAPPGSSRLQVDGPAVTLPADLATPFGLVLHELATNAAKHGSLSQRKGKVMMSWTVSSGNKERVLDFVWHETGGPTVSEPERIGFGSALIDNGIPGATVQREFLPAGLVCRIELPLPSDDDSRG